MALRDPGSDNIATATAPGLETVSGLRTAWQRIWRLRMALSVVLGLVCIEFCARLDDYISYRAPIFESYTLDRLYEFDSLGQRGKPHGQYRQWKLNSLGYRGPELVNGRTRIVCIGASETFGLYEAGGETYSRRLEIALNARAGSERYQVVNAGYAGLTLGTILKRLPETIDRLHPAALIYYATPANYIYPPNQESPRTVAPAVSAFSPRISESLRTLTKQVMPARVMDWYYRWSIKQAMKGRHPLPAVPQAHFNVFRDELLALIAGLRSRGVEPVLATHATRFSNPPTDEDRRMLVMWRKFYPILSEDGFLDMERRANDIIHQVGREQNVTVIDVAAELSGQTKYFADFSHFTTEGAERIGALLARQIAPVLNRIEK